VNRNIPFATMCGIILDNGRDCPGSVAEDSALNLCSDHLLAAYRQHAAIVGERLVMPEPCAVCGEQVGMKYRDEWQCDFCGFVPGTNIEFYIAKLKASRRVSVVYYIEFAGRIKIGTSTNPRNRLASLPVDRVRAFEPGWRDLEQKRHLQFQETRLGNTEWFEPNEALETHMRRLSAGVPDPWAQWDFWVRREQERPIGKTA